MPRPGVRVQVKVPSTYNVTPEMTSGKIGTSGDTMNMKSIMAWGRGYHHHSTMK
jgi:hypothetical protein